MSAGLLSVLFCTEFIAGGKFQFVGIQLVTAIEY